MTRAYLEKAYDSFHRPDGDELARYDFAHYSPGRETGDQLASHQAGVGGDPIEQSDPITSSIENPPGIRLGAPPIIRVAN